MAFIKFSQDVQLTAADIISNKNVGVDKEIHDTFYRRAQAVKKRFPTSEDFLYFHAVFMHAAEASTINLKTGEPLEGVEGRFDEKWNWIGNTLPYCNSNHDIFPEAELKKGHKGFIGRGLFVNHESNNAEKMRGLIVDAIYNDKFKRVEGLVALDKKQFPTLASQIENGYNTGVSMGTQVQTSICTVCGNSASKENEFCDHIKSAKGRDIDGIKVAEINIGLSPIELSIVSIPADKNAHIRTVVASMQETLNNEKNLLNSLDGNGDPSTLLAIQKDLEKIRSHIEILDKQASDESINNGESTDRAYNDSDVLNTRKELHSTIDTLKEQLQSVKDRFNYNTDNSDISGGNTIMNKARMRIKKRAALRRAYFQGTEEPVKQNTKPQYPSEDYQSIRDKEDKQMSGQGMESGREGMHPGYESTGKDEDLKKKLYRADNKSGRKLTAKELEDRQLKRRAFYQGTEEPVQPNTKPQYPNETDYTKIRDNEDKQMSGQGMEPGADGMHPGYESYGDEKKLKELLQRAHLQARLKKAFKEDGSIDKSNSRYEIYAIENKGSKEQKERFLFAASASQVFADPENKWDYFASQNYANMVVKAIREHGIHKVCATMTGIGFNKKALDPALPADPMAELPPEGGDFGDLGEPDMEGLEDDLQEDPTAEAISLLEEALTKLQEAKGTAEEALTDEFDMGDDMGLEGPAEGLPMPDAGPQMPASASLELTKICKTADYFIDSINKLADNIAEVGEMMRDIDDSSVRSEAVDVFNQLQDVADKKLELANRFIDNHFETVEEHSQPIQVDEKALNLLQAAGLEDEAKLLIEAAKKDKKDDKKKMKLKNKDKKDDKKKDKKEDKKEDKKDKKEKKASDNGSTSKVAEHDEECDEEDKKDKKDEEDKEDKKEKKSASQEFRARLAAKMKATTEGPISDKFYEAHPGGKGTDLGQLNTKTPEAKVETIEEAQDQDLAAATNPPTGKQGSDKESKVKTAEGEKAIEEAVKNKTEEATTKIEEAIDTKVDEEMQKIKAQGDSDEGVTKEAHPKDVKPSNKGDNEATKYYNTYWKESKDPAASAFAKGLTQDFTGKKKKASEVVETLKIKKAYDLAMEMQEKGMIGPERESVAEQADKLLRLDNDGFDAFKESIANFRGSRMDKKASFALEVGVDEREIHDKPKNLVASLSDLPWDKTKSPRF